MGNLTGRVPTRGTYGLPQPVAIPGDVYTGDAPFAQKVTVVGSVTYVGIAAPGTDQASPLWRCKKVDQTSGTVITWANGNANFTNIATDLTTLVYS